MDKLYRLFFVLSIGMLAFFLLDLWKDYNREWRKYQKAFRQMELVKARDDREREIARRKGYEFLQISVADGKRIDRCTMCHMGVEDPRFTNVPQPFKTHPEIPSHPFEKFGCTLCHQGQGLATTVKDGHGNVPFWDEPLLRGDLIQASCGSCHIGADLKEAPLITSGKRLFQERACVACHKIRGVGGAIGPDLTLVGQKRKDPEWHLRHFKDPQSTSPGSTMPSFKHLSDEELKALTVYMLSLREVPSALVAVGPEPR